MHECSLRSPDAGRRIPGLPRGRNCTVCRGGEAINLTNVKDTHARSTDRRWQCQRRGDSDKKARIAADLLCSLEKRFGEFLIVSCHPARVSTRRHISGQPDLVLCPHFAQTGFSPFAGLVAAPDARRAQIDFDLCVAVLLCGGDPGRRRHRVVLRWRPSRGRGRFDGDATRRRRRRDGLCLCTRCGHADRRDESER